MMKFACHIGGVVITLLVLTLVVGCGGGGTGEVTGVVTMDGTPVDGLEVRYLPVDDTGVGMALGHTHNGGKYKMVQGRGNQGISTGEYKVTISPAADAEPGDAPPVKLGPNYTSRDTTVLKATVIGGKNQIDFDLEGS